jgi:hypothetical protein
MEFIRRNCIHCGTRITNWFTQVLLQTLAVLFLSSMLIALGHPVSIVIALVFVAIYAAQIVILVRNA